MPIAERAGVLVDLRRERPYTGIARIIAAWRRCAQEDPDPIAVWERSQHSDSSPRPGEPLAIRRAARAAGAGLYHAVYPYVLLGGGQRNLLSLYDLLQLDRSGAHGAFFTRLLAHNVRRSAGILTISETSRAEICRRLDVDHERVAVAHIGVDPEPEATPDSARPYALYVGNAKPHKHVGELVGTAPRTLGAHGLELVTVVPADAADELRSAAPQGVRVLTGPGDDELARLRAGATLYVSLAEGEGFGLPPLEAAAHGVPAVLRDSGAHGEVMGDAAVLCSGDPDDVAAAVGRALGDLPALRRAARARAAHFSWEASWRSARAAHARFG